MIGKLKELWVQIVIIFIFSLMLEFLFEIALVIVFPASPEQTIPGIEIAFMQLISIILPIIPAILLGAWISEKTNTFEQVVIAALVLGGVGLAIGIVGVAGNLLTPQPLLEYNYIQATLDMPYEMTIEQFKYLGFVEVIFQSVVNFFGHLGLGFTGGLISLMFRKK